LIIQTRIINEINLTQRLIVSILKYNHNYLEPSSQRAMVLSRFSAAYQFSCRHYKFEEHMTNFTPLYSALGGMLIGLSAVVLMASLGRIAGMTGIIAGIIPPREAESSDNFNWRLVFLSGAILAPVILRFVGFIPPFAVPSSMPTLVIGGVLVGIGVHYGAGCPSGHGICGLARFSHRSLVAVVTFMITTAITVYIVRHVAGL
jgi:uncharacterized protein